MRVGGFWYALALGLNWALDKLGVAPMPWKIAQLIAAVLVLCLASCSKSEPEAVSEPIAAEAGGGDPTVIDSDHYSTEFENEAVRIVRIAYGAGEESVMHYHPDSVAVFVTDHLVQMTMPGRNMASPISAAISSVDPSGIVICTRWSVTKTATLSGW